MFFADLRADPADPLPAVVVEDDRRFPLLDEVLVHHVQHLEEGVVLGDVFGGVGFEAAGLARCGLPPDDQLEGHCLVLAVSAHYL